MQHGTLNIYLSEEEGEKRQIQQAADASYTERFYTLMRLIKVSSMIKNARIISAPLLPEKK